MFRALLALTIGSILGLTGIVGGAYYLLTEKVPVPEAGIVFNVRKGASTHEIARLLHKKELVRIPELFVLTSRVMRTDGQYKAGKYRITESSSLLDLLNILKDGQVLLTQFSIPEGLNQWQISEELAKSFPNFTKDDFVKELTHPDLLERLPPEAKDLEGYLFPETYSIHEDASPVEIFKMMIDMFFERKSPTYRVLLKDSGFTLHEAVTLASIIEKETGDPSERTLISGVFHNRLKRKMKLQTDPTVIYGMWHDFDGNIRKKDLRAPTPYNTYVIQGLPPGPIASPGSDSLYAAVQPEETDFLYFVAIGDESGKHQFSRTLVEHNRAVREYLKRIRRRRKL